jgi:CxxC motif-containing protein (DUF1111 family)
MRALVTVALALCGAGAATAQDITNLGGDLTSDLPPKAAVTLPSPNTASQERFNQHLDGFVAFNHSFLLDRGPDNKLLLGPRFNHESCAGCHLGDGKGRVGFSPTSQFSQMIIKVAMRGLNPDGSAREVPGVGGQLQDKSRSALDTYKIRLRWREIRGYFPDGEKYSLRQPALSFDIPSLSRSQRRRVVHSLRMAPSLIGMGLLEAVPAEAIIAASDPDDLNRDGISGRVSYVPNRITGLTDIGRFGFRATHPTVMQQTAAAFFNDMGMTNALFSIAGNSQEVSDEDLDETTKYLQFAGVTKARNQDSSTVVRGRRMFEQVGCAKCHTMTMTTGASAVPEVANQTFHPFTDLLLHDMGPELADQRPEFSASGREWRTTPLWGLGILSQLNDEKIRYLHDGRARTLQEAILWHGGEGRRARDAFKKLSKRDREALIQFLKSL